MTRKSLHNKFVAEIIAELGDVGSIDRILIDQAAWMLVQADDLQRQRNNNQPISDDDLTRARNGATRILLQLRASRPDPSDTGMTLAKYSALQATEKAKDA